MKLLSILLIVATIMCLTNSAALANTTASDVVTASDAGGGEITGPQIAIVVLIAVGLIFLLFTPIVVMV